MKRHVTWLALLAVLGLAPKSAAQNAPPPLPYEPDVSHAPSKSSSPTSPAVAPAAPSSSGGGATETPDDNGDTSAEKRPSLGLSPDSPQIGALPGGVMPAFGSAPTGEQDWRFDFHGLATLPLRAGVNTRTNAAAGQSHTVLHAPPGVPGDFGSFSYTGVVPDPWVQLNFSYGNPVVTMTVILAAKSISTAAGFFDPPSQLGINDAFLTFRLPRLGSVRANLDIGSFSGRYGAMGQYDTGRYGSPLIGTVAGTGETLTADASLGDVSLVAQHGIMGQLAKAPTGLAPAMWNDFADPNVGSSFVNHFHAGVAYKNLVQLSGHYLVAWSQDDRATPNQQPDGSIDIAGVDTRFTLGRFGHLYFGLSRVSADHARTVSGVIRVLNASGGPGLITEYLGPASGGTGHLTNFGAQYDLSLGTLLRYPYIFTGNGPDIFLSAFGTYSHVSSLDPDYDRVTRFKYGGEATYSMLSWLSVSGRYDRVVPNADDNYKSFAILSPRIIFRSKWNAQDQVVLQYSRYFYGSEVVIKSGVPPVDDPTLAPDKHVVSLSATMWW
jgi:hypothetical protein